MRRFEETSNEAHSRLKALMRDDDKRVQHKAIELWIKCAATAYSKDGMFTVAAPVDETDGKIDPEWAAQNIAHMNQSYKQDLQRIVDNRAKAGLPPYTEAEVDFAWVRGQFEDCIQMHIDEIPIDSDLRRPIANMDRPPREKRGWIPARVPEPPGDDRGLAGNVAVLLVVGALLVGVMGKSEVGEVRYAASGGGMLLPIAAEPRLLPSHPVTHPMQAETPVLPDRLPAYPSRVSMTSSVRLPSLALASVVVCAAPLAAHPIVPGFERFPTNADGGQLLLGELNCVSCHAADGQAKKQAPVLDNIGARARVSHLRKFLADPQAAKPGTTMPNLFAGDPERDAKVEALVHFLATTGATKQTRPDLKAVIRGRDTFTKIGCAACHGPRDAAGEPAKQTFAFAVPLGDVKGKYTIPGLTAFLSNPLSTRPSGRMPHLLKPNEAADVAHYLLQGAKSNLPTGKGTTRYAYYEGEWDKLPDFGTLKPKATGTGVAFELAVARRGSNYALRFEGVFPAESAGAYTFTLTSDDGSRLLIDGKKVVDVDGVHPPQTGSGKVELTKGIHKITVDFFQGGGEAVLDVEVESRSLGRQPLAPLVAATEADLAKKVEPKADPKDEDAIAVDPDLVTKGKALFASVGCASCHNLTLSRTPIASTAKANPLGMLKGDGGCLASVPKAGIPKYDLNSEQRKAIVAAIATPQAAGGKPQEIIARTMVTFNCYACHVRDKVGGPTEATNGLFTTTTPEMGEEGRVPPPLDGVGAKLNADYVKQILDKGADDRPYMHTSMPGFGQANVGHLPALFAAIDKLPAVAPTKFVDTEAKVVQAGRHMVGAQAFGCIKCHTFAG
ncbi:MAG TPA: c-type cytochrome, partial [Gemmataceae bacterium]|nr:c-type cytochrome [Gemmataceae bacterium]